MAYRITSPNAQELYQIDQARLARIQGANQDYELASIAHDHPDWTPTQVRMAYQGKLGGAPDTTRLLEGYGLPPSYRITGADPQEQPPFSAVNPRSSYRIGGGGNSLDNSLARQQNAFRLGQISKAQAKLDKLDPEDDNYDTRKSELTGRIAALSEESAASPAAIKPQAAIPLGEGTAGEEAPVWKPGGPDAFKRLSNGGSVYFGSVEGAPPFRVAPQSPVIQDMPPGGTIGPGTQPAPPPTVNLNKWSIVKNAILSGMGGGSPAVAAANTLSDPNNYSIEPSPATDEPAAPIPNISPKKIKLRNALQSEQKQLEDAGAPPEMIGSVSNRLYRVDNSVTNPPVRFGPTVSPDDAAAALPDYGTPAPDAPATPPAAAPKGIPVRNKKTGATGIQLEDGTIIPDSPQSQ